MLVIILTSLVVKLALLVPASHTTPFNDARHYEKAAVDLYDSGSYSSVRSPAWPATLYVSLHIASWGDTPDDGPPFDRSDLVKRMRTIAQLIMILMSTASVGLIFLLGRELFDSRAALTAAAIYAFYPPFIGYSHLLWAETQFMLLNLCWFWCLVRGVRSDRVGLVFAAGVLFGLASLTRQIIYSFLPVLFGWVLLVRPAWRTLRLVAVMALATLVTIGPWTIRNYRIHDAFVPIAPNSGLALLFGATDDFRAELKTAGVQPGVVDYESNRLAGARARAIILDDPAAWVRRLATKNLPALWSPGSLPLSHLRTHETRVSPLYPKIHPIAAKGMVVLFVLAYFVVLFTGIVGASLAPDWRMTLLTVGLTLHAMALHTVTSAFHRHRIFLLAFLVLYSGFLISRRRDELAALLVPTRLVVLAGSVVTMSILVARSNWYHLARLWAKFG